MEEFLKSLEIDEKIKSSILEKYTKELLIKDTELTKAKEDYETLETSFNEVSGKVKEFEGLKPDELKIEIANLTADLETERQGRAKEQQEYIVKSETESFLNSHKFINDLTKNSIRDSLNKAVFDDTNKGKSRQELLDSITKDEKGEILPNIFVEEQKQETMQDVFNRANSIGKTENETLSQTDGFLKVWGIQKKGN